MKLSFRARAPFRPAILLPLALSCLLADGGKASAQQTPFVSGNLVIAVEGCGVYGGTCTVPGGTGTGAGNSSLGGYGDNQAAPLTLFQFAPIGTTSATYVNSLVLPQSASGTNLPVSGEYGSSSEAYLQLSSTGQFLTLMGYGINAATFDASPAAYGAAPSLALAQSGSLTGQSYTPVPRVLALIDGRGNVSSSTAIYNIFNTNNPRSAFTADGTGVYVSGQGASGDATGGVFLSPVGVVNNAPTAITGLDTTNNTASQDTRIVQIVNGTLYASVDSKAGSNAARDFLGTLGTPRTLPTGTVGAPVMISGFGNTGGTGKVTINGNGNGLNQGLEINLSPEGYFFASPSVLYVTDTGAPKNNSAASRAGNGGLEKWINSSTDGSGTWSLAYTLHAGLPLVANTSSSGTSGLYGLAGAVSGSQVNLYVTNYTLTDLDATYLYGITDTLSATTTAQVASESFTQLAAAPSDSNFKGVSFAPTLAPETTLVVTSQWRPTASGYTLTVTVKNSGRATAEDVVLNVISAGGISLNGAPVALGPVAAGATASTSVSVPASVGSPNQVVPERIMGSYTGGSINVIQRAQLPQVQ